MKNWMRFSLASLAVAALVGGFAMTSTGAAGDDQKAINNTVVKMAGAVHAGKKADVKKMAENLAKEQEEVYYVMLAFKPRSKGGIGVGKKGQIFPDGIEQLIRVLSRDAPSKAKIKKNKDALIEMAYQTAAVAEFAASKHVIPTKRPKGKKSIESWQRYVGQMRAGSKALRDAVKTGAPASVKTAASKLNAACNNCHSEFR